MRLSDVKIGDKFYFLKEDNTADRMYLRIDLDASKLSPIFTSLSRILFIPYKIFMSIFFTAANTGA